MKNEKIVRASNFELLRIVAMVIIIIFHIFDHCIKIQLTDATSIAQMENGYFNSPIIYKRLFIADFCLIGGPISNAIFMLISGYFLSNKTHINMISTTKRLLSQLAFACLFLIFGSYILYSIPQSGINSYVGLIDISYFNSMSWYIGYYYIVVLTGKLFLNKYLSNLDVQRYKEFLLIILAIIELSWSGAILDGIIPGLRIIFTGIFLYSLGGFIRIYNPLAIIRLRFILFYSVFLVGLMYISAYNVKSLSIENYIINQNNIGDYIQTVSTYNNYHILALCTAILIFELFRRIPPFKNRIINYIGSATFMIYLIHDNSFFYSLWNSIDWIYLWYNSISLFLLNILKWTVIVFLIGLVANCIYDIISNFYLNKNKL